VKIYGKTYGCFFTVILRPFLQNETLHAFGKQAREVQRMVSKLEMYGKTYDWQDNFNFTKLKCQVVYGGGWSTGLLLHGDVSH